LPQFLISLCDALLNVVDDYAHMLLSFYAARVLQGGNYRRRPLRVSPLESPNRCG
jgi:hypothetical protein